MNFLGDTPFDELKDENAILNFIFSNSSISFAPPSRDARDVSRFESDLAVHKAWTLREAAAVTAAETDKLEDAKVMLDDLCTEAPERASAFNNRAQVRRLGGDLEGAKTDLDAAITLARAWLDVHAGTDHPLVEFHNKTLSNALTQRAAYFNATKGDAAAEAVDLAAAAKLGSQIAKMITTKVRGTGALPSPCLGFPCVAIREGGKTIAFSPCSSVPPTTAAHATPAVQPVCDHVSRGRDEDDGRAAAGGCGRARGRTRRGGLRAKWLRLLWARRSLELTDRRRPGLRLTGARVAHWQLIPVPSMLG